MSKVGGEFSARGTVPIEFVQNARQGHLLVVGLRSKHQKLLGLGLREIEGLPVLVRRCFITYVVLEMDFALEGFFCDEFAEVISLPVISLWVGRRQFSASRAIYLLGACCCKRTLLLSNRVYC